MVAWSRHHEALALAEFLYLRTDKVSWKFDVARIQRRWDKAGSAPYAITGRKTPSGHSIVRADDARLVRDSPLTFYTWCVQIPPLRYV